MHEGEGSDSYIAIQCVSLDFPSFIFVILKFKKKLQMITVTSVAFILQEITKLRENPKKHTVVVYFRASY